LEFLDQAGDHADRDVDDQDGSEEFGQPFVFFVLGPMPRRLQERCKEAQPDRHGHENEMVDRRHPELNSREIYLVHAHLLRLPANRPRVPQLMPSGRHCPLVWLLLRRRHPS
jgi:hypothetical protein